MTCCATRLFTSDSSTRQNIAAIPTPPAREVLAIAMALACAKLGLQFAAVMPEGVSNERVLMIRAYGGDVVFTPREDGLQGALNAAEERAKQSGAFLPRQFSNPDNPASPRDGS